MPSPRTIYWTVGVFLHVYVLLRVLTGPTDGYDLLLWIIGIAVVGAPSVSAGAVRGLIGRLPIGDVAIVTSLMLVCIVLHSHDLRDPFYTTTGDDIAFFHMVRRILERGIEMPFTLRGVYGTHPMLNSIYQASVSWVFGGSAWGWKFSSVLSVVLAVPAIYGLGYVFGGRVAGLIAAAILLSSHYVMAFSHIGYNQLDALPVIAWAMFAFVIGNNRKSPALLFAAGVIAGLGMYTILPARIILPLFAAWLVIIRMDWRQLVSLWPVALGFTICVLPLLAENGLYTISVMGVDTISPNSKHEANIGNLLDRLKTNIANNLFVWWWNPWTSHYTMGALLDLVSGLLAILGIGIAVGKWRHTDKLLIVWLVLVMIPTALWSPYGHIPLTRLHTTLIPLALLCGVGLSECLNLIKHYRILKYVAAGGLMVAIVTLNVWHFQVVLPNTLPHYKSEALAIMAWQSEECGRDRETLFIAEDGHQFWMNDALLTYIPEGKRPEVIAYEDPRVLPPWPACRIFFKPFDPGAQQRLEILIDTFSSDATVVSNPMGKSFVVVIP